MLLCYCGLKLNELYLLKLKKRLLSNEILESLLETEANAKQRHNMWAFWLENHTQAVLMLLLWHWNSGIFQYRSASHKDFELLRLLITSSSLPFFALVKIAGYDKNIDATVVCSLLLPYLNFFTTLDFKVSISFLEFRQGINFCYYVNILLFRPNSKIPYVSLKQKPFISFQLYPSEKNEKPTFG